VLDDLDRGRLALHLQAERQVIGEQPMVAAPALERHPQVGAGERGAGQHAIAAPGQAAAEPAQSLVVQLLHGGIGEGFELQGGDAGAIFFDRQGIDLRQLQRTIRAQPPVLVGTGDRPDKGHGRDCGVVHDGRRGQGFGHGGWGLNSAKQGHCTGDICNHPAIICAARSRMLKDKEKGRRPGWLGGGQETP